MTKKDNPQLETISFETISKVVENCTTPKQTTAREIIDKLLETYSYNDLHKIIDELYEQYESEEKQ